MPFRHPDDAEKWCEIHRTIGHDMEECKTFLDQKKMPPLVALAPQEARWVDQCRVDSDGDKQMGEINVIFRGCMSITSSTQGKKIQRDIQNCPKGTCLSW
jgi:hypothetical protein